MFRKIFALLTSSVCALSLMTTPVFSQDEDLMKYAPASEKQYYSNEYLSLKAKIENFENKSRQRLVISNEEKEEYEFLLSIKNSYSDYLYSQKNLSIEELKEQNYTDDQIDAIKNYDGSEEKTVRGSATVYGTLELTSFYYQANVNRTYASVHFSGGWNGSPIVKMQDCTAIGITGSNARFAKDSSSNTIYHANGQSVNNTYNVYHSMAGITYKFGICDANRNIFRSFSMRYSAVADGKVTVMDYGASYVHYYETIGGIGLSVGVGASPTTASIGLSFTFEKKGENMWQKIYTKK